MENLAKLILKIDLQKASMYKGHNVSKSKLQFYLIQVHYLGHNITQSRKSLSPHVREAINLTQLPKDNIKDFSVSYRIL